MLRWHLLKINDCNNYTDTSVTNAKNECKTYTDNAIATHTTTSNSYTDTAVENATTECKNYADTVSNNAKIQANEYTDNAITNIENEYKSYVDAQDSELRSSIEELQFIVGSGSSGGAASTERISAFGKCHATFDIYCLAEYYRYAPKKGILNLTINIPFNTGFSSFNLVEQEKLNEMLGINLVLDGNYVSGTWTSNPFPSKDEKLGVIPVCRVYNGYIAIARVMNASTFSIGSLPIGYFTETVVQMTNVYVEEA